MRGTWVFLYEYYDAVVVVVVVVVMVMVGACMRTYQSWDTLFI
jgi:hypothetical protein